MKIFYSILGISSFLITSVQVFAADPIVESPTAILPQTSEGGDFIAKIIAYFISLTAVLSLMAITWGAIQMVIASGEEEKIKKSRMMIIYAFVGLLASGMAYGIVKIVTNITF